MGVMTMFEYDESIEREAVIRVIGVGEFGLRAVGKMVDRIHKVKCLGVAPKGYDGPKDLPLVPFPWSTSEEYQGLAPFLDDNGADLVFIVANPDDDERLLKDICNTFFEKTIPVFLVIPESTYKSERISPLSDRNNKSLVKLDGVLIISESSMEPPYPDPWKKQDAQMLQDHFFHLAIRQISELITTSVMIGIDFYDVMHKICGGLMKFGAGIASGDGRAVKAAKIAKACLRKQGIELQSVTRAANCIFGSSNLTMDNYNEVNYFIHSQFNEECEHLLGVISDESLGDRLMVGIIAVNTPVEEAMMPRWARLCDMYEHRRHNNPTVRDPRPYATYLEDVLESQNESEK
jgi:cell division GTPase FtsZ